MKMFLRSLALLAAFSLPATAGMLEQWDTGAGQTQVITLPAATDELKTFCGGAGGGGGGGGASLAGTGVPGHAAAIVYLPGYRKANATLKFYGQSGWIWAEATGRSNHLGWAPSRALQGKAIAYEIRAVEDLAQQSIPKNEIVRVRRKITPLAISPFFFILLLMWILPLLSRIFMVIMRRKA